MNPLFPCDILVGMLVTACRVPEWVAVFGRVNHLDAEPGIQAYSA